MPSDNINNNNEHAAHQLRRRSSAANNNLEEVNLSTMWSNGKTNEAVPPEKPQQLRSSTNQRRTRRASYTRRGSNELAASLRLDQLRQLQKQLSVMIHDAKDIPPVVVDEEMGLDDSLHSRGSRSSPDSSFAGGGRYSHRVNDALISNNYSLHDHVDGGDKDGGYDVESGLLPDTYKPKPRQSPLVPTAAATDTELNTSSHVGSDITSSETKSLLTSSEDGTNPTLATSGTASAAPPNQKGELDSSTTSRKSRWSRSRDSARSVSRSLSRRRSSIRPRSSIFKKDKADLSTSGKSTRHITLPTYDFLSKEEEEDQEGGSLRPGAKWWRGVFVFSLISMLACVITLW